MKELQASNQKMIAESSPSLVIRVLGVLVGLLFVAMPPLMATSKGSVSIGDIGFCLLSGATGVLFIGYGLLGRTDWVKVPAQHRAFWSPIFGATYIAAGLSWVVPSDGSVIQRILGAWLFFFGCRSILSVIGKGHAKPTA